MRLISVTTKKELVAALAKRYAAGKREEKSRILDQFVSISGMHRKHAMRLLRGRISNRNRERGRRFMTRRPDRLLLFCGKPPTASVASD